MFLDENDFFVLWIRKQLKMELVDKRSRQEKSIGRKTNLGEKVEYFDFFGFK